MKRFLIIIGTLLLFLPLAAGEAASVTTSTEGCFERESADTRFTFWMKAPICTITFGASTEVSIEVTVLNLDPQRMKVTDGSLESAITRGEESLTIVVTIPAGASEITIKPWDYSSTDSDFWFTAISDPQNRNAGELNSVFTDVKAQYGTLNPAFVTVSGDIIKGSTSDPEMHNTEYELHDAALQAYDGMHFLVPGDHDARQDFDDYYEKFFGPRDTTFDYGNTTFIGINTTEDIADEGRLTESQLDWLEDKLDSASGENIIVFMQHPLVPPSWANSTGIVEDQRLELGTLFTSYGVDLVLVGDAHGFEDKTINSTHITGLDGSVRQLVLAGSGGQFKNYDDTDHFSILIHVDGTDISYEFMERSETDVDLDYSAANDGTQTTLDITYSNAGSRSIPYWRIPFNLNAGEDVYASDADGNFIEITRSEMVGDVLRGYIELTDVPKGTTETLTVGERTAILSGIDNVVKKSGVVTYTELPTSENTVSDLAIVSATKKTTITVTEWGESQMRWTEKANKKTAKTRFKLRGLVPSREYLVYVDGAFKKRLVADSSGDLTFSNKQGGKKRNYRVVPGNLLPDNFAALPAEQGGPNVRIFSDNEELEGTFFAYSESLKHGYDSIWADVDGDDDLEIVTVPRQGAVSHVRVFEIGGKELASWYPYGKSYTGGVSLSAADLDGDGDDEVVTAPLTNRKSTVRVYRYKKSEMTRLKSFRAFGVGYTDGATVTSGDLDGDGDDEIIVGKQVGRLVRVYKWKNKKQTVKKWASDQVLSDPLSQAGVSLAVGDMDFDGRDELVVGSRTAGSEVRMYNFNAGKGKLKLKNTNTVFNDTFTEGVQVTVADMNTNSKPEVIVAQQGGETSTGKVVMLRARPKKSSLAQVLTFSPFGSVLGVDLNVAPVDVNGDGAMELAMGLGDQDGRVRVYDKRGSGMKRLDSFNVYDSGFVGGISVTRFR